MSLKSYLSRLYAGSVYRKIQQWSKNPFDTQQKVFENLIKSAKNTQFGKTHCFSEIRTYPDFKKNVPIRDYEGLKEYIDLIKQGQADVLWPGKPIYLSKTSGTTSGTKYIPISKQSIHKIGRAHV